MLFWAESTFCRMLMVLLLVGVGHVIPVQRVIQTPAASEAPALPAIPGQAERRVARPRHTGRRTLALAAACCARARSRRRNGRRGTGWSAAGLRAAPCAFPGACTVPRRRGRLTAGLPSAPAGRRESRPTAARRD